jgi:2-furoyl-CoA dehydrogenase FAD binding subunit
VRFPISAQPGVAFRETARRHGDFAIVAVAAAVLDRKRLRLGVGGMTDCPAVREIEAGGADIIRDQIERLAWELEGYDDIHASPRLRRDLLRRLAPTVIEEAVRCAA